MAVVKVDKDLKEILPGFIKNRENDIISLKSLLDEGDIAGIQKIGHKVAGSAGGYGFDELGKIAKDIENLAKAGDIEGVKPLIKSFEDFLSNVEIEFVE